MPGQTFARQVRCFAPIPLQTGQSAGRHDHRMSDTTRHELRLRIGRRHVIVRK
jgi:hypothetical protein